MECALFEITALQRIDMLGDAAKRFAAPDAAGRD